MESGRIFDIKEFALYDGPGIRETIFFKGCPLRCNWCHNPEGLEVKAQIMVSPNACKSCGKCLNVCKHKEEGCITCGECVNLCPENARRIVGTLYTSDELVNKIMKDADFYKTNKGGVTFSGGEPLLQHKFLIEVLDKLPNVHKAIETSGYTKPEIFNEVLKRIDYVIMDIKLMNPEIHKKYTGVSNELILENAKTLMLSGKPHRLRVPVIPGVNDTVDNMEELAKYVSSINKNTPIELLPYHQTAGAKYNMVGLEYKPIFNVGQKPIMHEDIFVKYGLEVKVL